MREARLAELDQGTCGELHLTPTPYTLRPTPCTLHPTPYTLHPTTYHIPYTIHPTPYALHWQSSTKGIVVSATLLAWRPVDPSFRAFSSRLNFTVRRRNFNKDSLSWRECACARLVHLKGVLDKCATDQSGCATGRKSKHAISNSV